ncbi:MAG: hypothetical protein CND29_02910 [Marine Group II euryarchaeote MED-G36]|nr:MAG: hypothetical protein CND29_02910 [Marine Group II euryarchaeote MED-G36]
MLSLEPMSLAGQHEWLLPPSKSHMIRWLTLASQGNSECGLQFEGEPGKDVESMVGCLEKMGVEVVRGEIWVVCPPENGLKSPDVALNCGNSGTAARILTALSATIGGEVKIDGDESLRSRSSESLNNTLRELGCEISSDRVPYTVKGPIKGGETSLDLGSSSQPLTALALSSPSFSESVILNLQGQPVSRGYSQLTFDITSICGSPNIISNPLSLNSWEVQTPNIVNIPPELSLFPMAIILELLYEDLALRTSLPTYDPLVLIAIDEIDRANGGQVDLRDASDLVTPAAVWMALTNGGEITGIPHARGKESNRISRTVELLSSFGMVSEETEDGLKILGGQRPTRPDSVVETHMDHRLAMVAIILASKVGGDILNPEICEVTHPGFVEQLISLSQP